MSEKIPQEEPKKKALEDLPPQVRLREIAKMKKDVEEEMERLKGESVQENNIEALRNTWDTLDLEEQAARKELRGLN